MFEPESLDSLVDKKRERDRTSLSSPKRRLDMEHKVNLEPGWLLAEGQRARQQFEERIKREDPNRGMRYEAASAPKPDSKEVVEN
jgi:hypothetical protein